MSPKRHERFELNQHHKLILIAIGWYYNGVTYKIGDEKYKLGLNAPPEIKKIIKLIHSYHFDEPFDWDTYQSPLMELRMQEYLQKAQIAHKYINWAPRRKARRIMDDKLSVNSPAAKGVPKYYDFDGGLVGDLNESLRHRWGVEVGARVLVQMNPEEYWIYPGAGAAQRFDMKWILNGQLFAEEVLTDHHAKRAYRKKYLQAADSECGVRYLFQSGDLAKRVLNDWHQSDDVPCELKNFPVSDSHAFCHVENYVRDSVHSSQYYTPGIVGVDTIHRHYDNHIN